MAKNNATFMGEFSTVAKYSLQNWTRLLNLIKKYGAAPKDSPTDLPQTVVLQDAFNGGFSFCFRSWVSMLVRLEQVMVLLRDWRESPDALTPDAIKQFGCESIEVTKVPIAKVEKLRKKLLTDIKKQDKPLQQLHADCAELVCKQLTAQGVSIGSQQQKQLISISTRRALYHHLTEAKHQPFDRATVLSFSDYFRYKTLSILPVAQGAALLKKLEPCFQQIQKQAQQWVMTHIEPMRQQVQDVLKAEETV